VQNDYECFNISTSRGRYSSILEAWDSNQDGRVSQQEWHTSHSRMNLDSNSQVSNLEVEAYLSRNKYVLCKPYAEKALDDFNKKLRYSIYEERPQFYTEFFDHLDWEGNLTKNITNSGFNKTVFAKETAPILDYLCSNELKIKQMNRNKEGKKFVVERGSQDLGFSFD